MKNIISITVLILINLIILGVIILIGNVFIGLILALISILISFLFYCKYKDYNEKRKNKILNDKFHELKDKDNNTLYETLFIKAYNSLAIDIVKNIISQNKIEYIHKIQFEVEYNKDYITLSFEHKKHKVYYIIYKNKVVYFIHRASKYHHIEVCKEFEEAKMINICINNYETLESFFDTLIPSIKNNIEAIDEFENSFNLVNIKNYILDEVIIYKNYIKRLAKQLFIVIMLYMIVLICANIGIINGIMTDFNNIVLYINTFILLDGSFICVCIYNFYLYKKYKVIEKDIKTQDVLNIKAKPYKAKLIIGSSYHSRYRYVIGIKLYFKDNIKLILPYDLTVPNKEQKESILKILVKNELELKYYKNSKLIVSGTEPLIKKIKAIYRK